MLDDLSADLQHYSRLCYCGQPIWRIFIPLLYAHPAALAVIWYRFGSAAWRLRIPVARQVLQIIYLMGMPLVRMYSGIQIQPQTEIGPGLTILHFGGVVITRECTIGPNCLLYHNVNIVTMRNYRGPTIGKHFYAGTGATILGTISIGDNVTVGANAVVTKSVPPNAVVAGVPARILRFREPGEDPSEGRTGPNRPSGWLEPSRGQDAQPPSRVSADSSRTLLHPSASSESSFKSPSSS
jgi:serine O-acetyltransferase